MVDYLSGLPDYPQQLQGLTDPLSASPGTPLPAEPPNNPLAVAPVTRDFIQKFFEQKGVPPQVAAGWAQRLMMESGGNPLAVNPSSGALGLAQDLGPRRENLLALPNWADPNVQLQNVWNEMHGGDALATREFSNMMAAPSTQAAYQGFTHYFERPGAAGGDVMAQGTTHPGSDTNPDFSGLQTPVTANGTSQTGAPVPNLSIVMPTLRQPERMNPLQIVQMVQAMMGGTHKFTPIDYDPWAVQRGAAPQVNPMSMMTQMPLYRTVMGV